MRVLVLGGTSEAMQLARLLAGQRAIDALFSLAGRTANPAAPPIPSRMGGFGGAEGLADFLRKGRFGALVDATHPFAAQMSHHAFEACAALGLPLCALSRPPWQAGPGDSWMEVPDLSAAALALGPRPRRVFLTTGRLGISVFASAPQHHYLFRSIDPLVPPPAFRHSALLARPPFSVESETALMRAEAIDILVTKNSGAQATAAKLAAARALGLPVIMVQRPALPGIAQFGEAATVLDWLNAHAPLP